MAVHATFAIILAAVAVILAVVAISKPCLWCFKEIRLAHQSSKKKSQLRQGSKDVNYHQNKKRSAGLTIGDNEERTRTASKGIIKSPNTNWPINDSAAPADTHDSGPTEVVRKSVCVVKITEGDDGGDGPKLSA